jgi:hypothetical protein
MSENVQTAMFEILKAIQASIVDLRAEVVELRTTQDRRMESIEEVMRKQRRDMAGILVLVKGAAGVFKERVSSLETVSRLSSKTGSPEGFRCQALVAHKCLTLCCL